MRAATVDDIDQLQALEVEAGQAFADWGMPEIAAHAPPSAAEFQTYIDLGQAWVTLALTPDCAERIAGFVLVDRVDGCAHIEQLSVHPNYKGQRLGAGLIDWVAHWAVTQRLTALTLTTFVQPPWNAPYYQRCGFRALTAAQQTPGLTDLRAHEAELGLDAWPRVCMRRELSSTQR